MASVRGSGGRLARASYLCGATALACVFVASLPHTNTAFGQSLDGLAPQVDQNEQMLLEADQLIYDNDRETVTAEGAVQIDYAGNRLVAQRVTYDRKTGRLMALGNVEIVDGDGNRIFSDEIDITDDFRDGFVNAMRVETVDRTYFGAESAQRRDGTVTTFNNGVYTACEPCEDDPARAPIWRIKARKIIWNGEEKTVLFERASFELFGLPIIQLPYFKMPDPTVKRKSGFLIPGINYKTELGVGVTIPYYLALSPTYDLLLRGTYHTKQGFLGQAEWRQRFDNGQYNIRIAGIRQNDPSAFASNTGDSVEKARGMIATKGDFRINPRWSFGWDVLAQSDKNFSRTYSIDGYNKLVQRSELYLTGLNDRNFFDLRAYKFHVQEAYKEGFGRDHLQPTVLPSFDYTNTPDEPILGGQLRFDVNAQGLDRSNREFSPATPALRGIGGQSGRLTAEAEWKRQVITAGGGVFTPILHARADGIAVNQDAASAAAMGTMAASLGPLAYTNDGTTYGAVATDLRSSYFRSMVTAGFEFRWPILFSDMSSSHILEPMAQVFVRPNESYGRSLGIPNEDAQSFVFDATTLFERDKFSGYDRVEGGTRANVGFRYSGSFASGWNANGIFGQSYHLSGDNPYASPDLVNVGAFSGLETETSDFVGLVGVTSPRGLALSVSGRFDEQTFEVRRAELKAGLTANPVSVSARFAYIQSQPLYGFNDDRKELTLAASTRFNENWSAFGSGTHDFVSSRLVRTGIGFSYDDECFTYSMTLTQVRPTTGNAKPTQSIGFNLSFRTLGDFGSNSGVVE